MLRVTQPATWWSWAFRFAKAAELCGSCLPKAKMPPAKLERLRQAWQTYFEDATLWSVRWAEAGYCPTDVVDCVDHGLLRVLCLRDVPLRDTTRAELTPLTAKGWARSDGGVVRLTRTGIIAAAQAGIMFLHRPQPPGPIGSRPDFYADVDKLALAKQCRGS